uniref:Uncharacterized protein MANES_12G042400 n=1 Tax=Rhizophora mucronata TaxID=61149 RepID=A0A2P2IMV1_RHIMU
MNSEAHRHSGQWIQQQHGSAAVVPDAGKIVHNISVQTGEEFSMEFLQDRVATRGIPPMPAATQNCEKRAAHVNDQNHQLGYQDLACILGIRRMDSDCPSDISDFASAKGSPKENENGVNVDKLSRYDAEDGDMVHRSRKAFSELNYNWRDGSGSSTAATRAPESAQSNNSNGPGVSDRSHPGNMKFLCSSGGKILPRPSDGKLRYVGGETRIISISENLKWEELVKKTLGICNGPHSIKYQLPGEDLDALISVSSDEDLQNMMEEYHALETLWGSQRLRIFLIPLAELEKTSLEGTTIQHCSPDYRYVVAVNGILDPTPRTNSGGHALASEASQPGTILDGNPSFGKQIPCSQLALDFKGGINSFHPAQMSSRFQNMVRPPYQSPPISPIPLKRGDSKSGYMQLYGDNSSLESNSSFITAQLPHKNYSGDTDVHKETPKAPGILANGHLPIKWVDGGQPDKNYEAQFCNHNVRKEFVVPAVHEQKNGDFSGFSYERHMLKGRAFHSDKPVSTPDDSGCLLSGSIDSIDSHHGLPHSFSDSKLQEHGGTPSYCSQEGMSPSSPLSFSKTLLSPLLVSSIAQEKATQLPEDVNLVDPNVEARLLDIQPPGSQSKLVCQNQSPFSDSEGKVAPIQDINSKIDGNCWIPNHCESLLGLETFSLHEKIYPEKAVVSGEYKHKLHDVECNPKTFDINSLAGNLQVFGDTVSASSAMDLKPFVDNMSQNSHNYQLKKVPSDLLGMDEAISNHQYHTLSRRVNGEQVSNFPLSQNPQVEEAFQNGRQQPRDENSLVDLMSGSLDDPSFPESAQVQTLQSQNGMVVKAYMPKSSKKVSLNAVHDTADLNKLHQNDPHTSAHNICRDASAERDVFLLGDNYEWYTDHKVQKLGFGGAANGKSSIEEIIFPKTETQRTRDQNQLEPSFVIKDVTDNVPCSIPSSCADVLHITEPTGCALNSESIIPHVCPQVDDQTSSDLVSPIASENIIPESEMEDISVDDGNEDESISDAAIAEMEASIYGLQIIKNVDLEELQELGSGTYGTVYHGRWRGTDVAIKRIKKSCFSGRSSEQERLTKDFWREAQILSNLHHPNVVAFYGVVPDGAGGTLATVTEYMVNGSLRHVLLKNDRSLDRRKKLIIAMDAAFGMEYLHSKNIVHFDLKCDNLLVNLRDPHRPICKVADFGLSRIKHNTLVSGGVRGTLPWMAPELLNGSSSRVSEKVDVFSFGISMWEILTSEEPYADMHCGAIIGGIVKNTLRPPIPVRCEPEWRKLMEQCWSPDPETRPSFTEITNRLRSMSIALRTKGNNMQARQMKQNHTS